MPEYCIYAIGVHENKDAVYPDEESAAKELSRLIDLEQPADDEKFLDENGAVYGFEHDETEMYQCAYLHKMPETAEEFHTVIADRLYFARREYAANLETTDELADIEEKIRQGHL